jgi:hypothetical protein
MKRTELIEYGVIIVGLILGYQTITAILGIVVNVLISFNADFTGGIGAAILTYFLYISTYSLSFFLVIKFRKKIAKLINGPADETVNLNLNKKSILHITIIAIGITTIVSVIPEILMYLFRSFKNSVESYDDFADNFGDKENQLEFWGDIILLAITIILLRFSSNIAGYFAKETDTITTTNQKPNEETN